MKILLKRTVYPHWELNSFLSTTKKCRSIKIILTMKGKSEGYTEIIRKIPKRLHLKDL